MRLSIPRTLVVAGIMVLTVVLMQYLSHAEDVRPNKPFSTFPKSIGEWSGEEKHFDTRIYEVLGVDDSFLGEYRTPDGRYAQLYIGFYQSQREGELIHSPKNCMPGGGWTIVDVETTPLTVASVGPDPVHLIKLRLKNGPSQQLVLYWYHSRGRIISSEYWQKIFLVIDSITRHRTDGSFVRLIAPIPDEKGESAALADLKDFAREVFPILMEFIPS